MQKFRISKQNFNPIHTFECGQIFRYYKDKNNCYFVYSGQSCAKISESGSWYIIQSNNVKYFENFFDIKTNYAKLKTKLLKYHMLKEAINFGYGIRILKQPIFEVIVSFIISQNNNIKRIQSIIEKICTNFGTKIVDELGDYFAFPTQEQFLTISEESYTKLGLGYRAEYLKQTVPKLTDEFCNYLLTLNTKQARAELIKLKGIGRKVADCILLFGLNKKDVFPVDVWIEKMFYKYFSTEISKSKFSRDKISDFLVNKFSDLSGLAQQYLYYLIRENY